MKRMNVTQYAKHRGCSRQAVYDALDAGRIVREPDKKIDAEKADRMWAELTDPGKGGHQPPQPGATRGKKVNGDHPRQAPHPEPVKLEKTLEDCKKRLTRAVEIIPELAPFEGFVNLEAATLHGDVREHQTAPILGPFTLIDAHQTLSCLALEYLEDSGQVKRDLADLVGEVLLDDHWPECEEDPDWQEELTEALQKKGPDEC